MNQTPFPDAFVVAVDFSPCSIRALDTAMSWQRPGTELTLLHVVDADLAHRMERVGVTSYDEAIAKMRARADEELCWLKDERRPAEFETMVVEGLPFLEIIKIASDLDCALIVLGSRGTTSGLKEVLFGSTAEKVLRGARQPVLCVP